MKRIAIVNLYGDHVNTALDAVARIALANQADTELFDCLAGQFPRPRKFDGYVVTGGLSSPVEAAPWRVRLQAAIPEWAKSKPIFAIGLGFQVMSASFGWPVRALSEAREGIFPVTPTPAGWEDPIMVDLEYATPVMEKRSWAVLPPPAATRSKAVVLAYTSNGDVAAARFTPHASGTIFHPEARVDGTASTVLARFITGIQSKYWKDWS